MHFYDFSRPERRITRGSRPTLRMHRKSVIVTHKALLITYDTKSMGMERLTVARIRGHLLDLQLAQPYGNMDDGSQLESLQCELL